LRISPNPAQLQFLGQFGEISANEAREDEPAHCDQIVPVTADGLAGGDDRRPRDGASRSAPGDLVWFVPAYFVEDAASVLLD
jgi:hypothetical protein